MLVLQTVIKYGSEEDWFYLLDKARNLTTNTERFLILRALASTKDFNLLKMFDRNSLSFSSKSINRIF